MKIALPLLSKDLVSDHFGHSKMFLIAETEGDKIVNVNYYDAPKHEFGSFPVWLISMNVNVLLCKGLGHKAVEILNSKNVEVFPGVTENNPIDAINAYLAGKVEKSDVFCSGGDSCH